MSKAGVLFRKNENEFVCQIGQFHIEENDGALLYSEARKAGFLVRKNEYEFVCQIRQFHIERWFPVSDKRLWACLPD
jgi:hypothetical protein